MKKVFKGIMCAGLSLSMLAAVGCAKQTNDPEVRPLKMAIGAVEQNFNPFFYTSQNDGEMAGLTQVSMFSSDRSGKLTWGENEPSVVKNFEKIYLNSAKEPVPESSASTSGYTEYRMLIKKGIRFSDGVELTIDDVLFNVYVYLDPAYTGSSTLYSTNIVGLNSYRAQEELPDPPADGSGDSSSNIDSMFDQDVELRFLNILDWIENGDVMESEPSDPTIKADVKALKEYFLEETKNDWAATRTSWHDAYKNDYRFTEAWQAFLFANGIIKTQTRSDATYGTVRCFEDLNGNGKKDDGEKYYTTLDANQPGVGTEGEIQAQAIIDGIAEATTPDKVRQCMEKEKVDESTAKLILQGNYCVEYVYQDYSERSKLPNVLYSTAGNKLEQKIIGELRKQHYEERKENGKLAIPNVKGITTEKVTSFAGQSLDGEYDMLKVLINGIDPKAEFNFGFAVAPLHYYSGTWNGKDYVKAAKDNTKNDEEFGVELGDTDFFEQVLKGEGKNALPVGAGCYKASTINGGTATSASEFCPGAAMLYFERNEYFTTLGSGINNAIIKRVNYKVTEDDKIMDALKTGEIDYGTPNATPENVSSVKDHLSSERYATNGYGYVGVNPRYIPNVWVRRAIMSSMNTSSIISNYYGSELAEVIHRPMSKESWAYPKNCTVWDNSETSIKFDATGATIDRYMAQAGYEKGADGYYQDAQTGEPLGKIVLTIAGSSQDHPAYQMFQNAAILLKAHGINADVSTDPNALMAMTRGELWVWAAAYTQAIDPDMYQVYHKNSRATSVKNWGYEQILDINRTEYEYERGLLDELSADIDRARRYLDQNTRAEIYSDCLDTVMELAYQLPTYQRNDLCVYNRNVLDRKSMTTSPNCYMGLIDRLWEINYV